MSEIEFRVWDTPIAADQLLLVGLKWGHGGLRYGGYEIGSEVEGNTNGLEVQIFALELESIYTIIFESVIGFRMTDELDYSPGHLDGPGSTFLVRDQANLLTAHNFGDDGQFNFVIATDNECLEIAVASSDVQPRVDFVRNVGCDTDHQS